MVAAILGLRRAAEAGTTRATPSAGVARNRVREEDGAKARKPCYPVIQVITGDASRLFKAEAAEDSLARRERGATVCRRHPCPRGWRGEWQLLGSRLPPAPVA